MCHKAIAWAWEQDLPPTTKLVLLALAHAVNGGYRSAWGCCPGQSRLAAECGISERQVIKHLQELKRRGLIEITPRAGDGRGRRSNAYRLCPAQHVLDLDPPTTTTSPGLMAPIETPAETLDEAPQKFTLPGGQGAPEFTLPGGGKVNFLSGNVNQSSLCIPIDNKEEDREEERVLVTTPPTRASSSPGTLSQDPEFDWRAMARDLRPDLDAEPVWLKCCTYHDGKHPGTRPTAVDWRMWLLREWKNNRQQSKITIGHRSLGGFAHPPAPPPIDGVYEVHHEH